jgi:hypothetical protein
MNNLQPGVLGRLCDADARARDALEGATGSGGESARARSAALIAYATRVRRGADLSATERQALDEVIRRAVAAHMARAAALSRILAAFGARGLRMLVLKGAAHAALYPAAYLRPRTDDDILVAPEDFERASALVIELGYTRALEVDAGRITKQRHYSRADGAITHHVDLHRRIVNAPVFATLPTFDDLWTRRRALSEFAGFSAGPVDALLLAAAHRVAHHPRTSDLLWSLDMHLLATSLEGAEWDELCTRARECRVAALVGSELDAARQRWGTVVPTGHLAALRATTGEPSAAYLKATGTLSTEWLNFRHQGSVADRLSMLREHVFPSPAYMHGRYGTAGPLRLAWLYVRRATTGGVRWMREHHAVRRGA